MTKHVEFALEQLEGPQPLTDQILAGVDIALTYEGRTIAVIVPLAAADTVMEEAGSYAAGTVRLPSTALTRLVGSAATRSVLGVFLRARSQRLYQREVARRAGIGLRSAQLALQRLVDLGVLYSTRSGNRLYYEAAQSPRLEQLRELLDGELGIQEVLVRHLRALDKPVTWAFIFGSLAAERDTIDSDIDIVIVSEADQRLIATEIAEAERELGREIDVTVYRPAQFRQRLADRNHFLVSVLDAPRIDLIGGPPDVA